LYGNGFFPKTTILKDTIEGQASANADTARFWKIINQNKLNPYSKDPVGFKVVSHSNTPMFAKPGSVVHSRAGFASKTLWVSLDNISVLIRKIAASKTNQNCFIFLGHSL
jgi:primary-amine oxidase